MPGLQGIVTGTHGMGVSVPIAAAVAAATVGFVWDLHIPNGRMLVIGAQSMMLAAGMTEAVTVGATTIKVEGARPWEHVSVEPLFTCFPAMAVGSCTKDSCSEGAMMTPPSGPQTHSLSDRESRLLSLTAIQSRLIVFS